MFRFFLFKLFYFFFVRLILLLFCYYFSLHEHCVRVSNIRSSYLANFIEISFGSALYSCVARSFFFLLFFDSPLLYRCDSSVDLLSFQKHVINAQIFVLKITNKILFCIFTSTTKWFNFFSLYLSSPVQFALFELFFFCFCILLFLAIIFKCRKRFLSAENDKMNQVKLIDLVTIRIEFYMYIIWWRLIGLQFNLQTMLTIFVAISFALFSPCVRYCSFVIVFLWFHLLCVLFP